MTHLHLCHARMREFRGQTLYAVPSMFLDELPAEVERLDLGGTGQWPVQPRTCPGCQRTRRNLGGLGLYGVRSRALGGNSVDAFD